MLVQRGEHRTHNVDRQLATYLAAVAGALNAAAFHAVGFFSANMTGNVSLLADHLATGGFTIALFFVGIVAAFVAGSTVSTLLINAGQRRGLKTIYAYTILLEAILLGVIGLLDMMTDDRVRVAILVIGLSFLMGLQNAIVTRISNARVRTTHVSGMLTDIGIELGELLDIRRGRESIELRRETRDRLRLHTQTVIAFALGGIAGVLSYQAFGSIMLFATAAILIAIAVPAVFRARSQVT